MPASCLTNAVSLINDTVIHSGTNSVVRRKGKFAQSRGSAADETTANAGSITCAQRPQSGTNGPPGLSAISGEEAPSLATADIRPAGDSAIQGYGMITRVARSVDVSVLVVNAPGGVIVVIQPGSCSSLDNATGNIEQVGAVDERGISTATLPIRLTELLNLGTHAIVLYEPSDVLRTGPLACGVIVAGSP